MDSFRRSVIGGVKWTTLSTIVRSVVRLLQIAILTRFLPKEAFGTIAIATVFISFTDIFMDLGISAAILHKQDISPKEYSSLFWLNVFSGIFICVLLVCLSPMIALSYKDVSLTPIIQLLSLNILFSSMGRQHLTIQQKKQRFKLMACIEMAASLLTMMVAVATAYFGLGVYSLVASSLFSCFVTNVSYLIYGHKHDANVSFHFRFSDTLSYIKIGVYQIGSSVLDFLSRELDTVIVSYTLGRDLLGLYSLCKHIILALYGAVNPILMRVLTPVFAIMQDNKRQIKDKYTKTISFLATTNMPLYVMIAAASSTILFYLYGRDYVEGNIIMACFALSYGILSINNPVGALQVSLGRTDIGFYWTVYRIITNSLVILIGASISVHALVFGLLLYTVVNIIPFWRIQLKVMLNITLVEYIRCFLPQILLSIICAIPYFVLFFFQVNLVLVIIYSILFLLVYLEILKIFDKENILLSLITQYVTKIWQ